MQIRPRALLPRQSLPIRRAAAHGPACVALRLHAPTSSMCVYMRRHRRHTQSPALVLAAGTTIRHTREEAAWRFAPPDPSTPRQPRGSVFSSHSPRLAAPQARRPDITRGRGAPARRHPRLAQGWARPRLSSDLPEESWLGCQGSYLYQISLTVHAPPCGVQRKEHATLTRCARYSICGSPEIILSPGGSGKSPGGKGMESPRPRDWM